MKQVPLTNTHLELKAKMGPFAGFSMPLQYTSVREEVQTVRSSVGVFDVSHMGEFWIEGEQASDLVDYVLTNDFKNSPVGKAVYSPICMPNGGIIDDLIAYKLSQEQVLVCVNASNITKDFEWFESQKKKFPKATLKNVSQDWSLLALQGPRSQEILESLTSACQGLEYYGVSRASDDLIIARTGYTGEDGFELFCHPARVEELWNKLMQKGTLPCGLIARDILRLEVCYPLYGNELTQDLNPLETGLKWTVKLEKEDFIGKEFLKNHSAEKSLVKLLFETPSGLPRTGQKIFNSDGEEVGSVTSGGQSMTLNKPIALGLVKASESKNDHYFVEIRQRKIQAQRVKKPFVQGSHL